MAATRRYLRVFCSYYFVAFIPWGIVVPYLPLFYQRTGRSEAEIGALQALSPLLMIVSPPIWGAVADRCGNKKAVLLLLLALSAAAFPGLWFGRSFGAAMALLGIFAFFFAAAEPLADAITMENLPRAGGDYGRIRLWGSLGFIFPLLLMGAILRPESGAEADPRTLAAVFVLFAAFRLLAMGWAARLPAAPEGHVGHFDWAALRVLRSGAPMVLVMCALASRIGTQGLFVFFSIYLDELGVGDNLKGYFWALGVISEVAVMYFAGRIMARISLKWLFALGLAGSAARLFAFSFPLSHALIAAVAPLQGLSFAAFQVPAVTYVSQVAPPHLRASAQALFAAVVGGVGGVVGAQVAGALAQAVGVLTMFRIMSLVVAAALVAFLSAFRPQQTAAPEVTSDAVSLQARTRR